MSFSVILPTLNEKGHIIELIEEISNIFILKKKEFEIIVVDDNSADGTQDVVEQHLSDKKYLKLIKRKSNIKNLADAIQEGVNVSKNKYIIWMDADFQHPPKYIKNFIEISDSHDVIISSRFLKKSERYFNSNKLKKEINENQSYLFNKLCKIFLFKDLTDYTSGFICVRKEILQGYSLKGYYGDYFVKLLVYLKKIISKLLKYHSKTN